MKQTIIISLSFLFIHCAGYAQTADSIYNLTAYGNIGFVRNITTFDYEYASLDRSGLVGNIKIMWKPDYLIRAGIEVGRSDVYSVNEDNLQTEYGMTNLQTDVYAWTFMGVFSMSPLEHFEVNVATGLAFTTVNNSAFETESTSTDFGSVFMISAGYFFPLSNDFKIGAELRGMKIAKYDDYTLALQVSVVYKFLEW